MNQTASKQRVPKQLPTALLGLLALSFLEPVTVKNGWASGGPSMVPVQVPYEPPPKPGPVPDTTIPPSSKPLDADEIKRAEALLPLLEGKQEFWAMGEFVHSSK